MGFAMAPMKDGQVVPPAEFNAWPAERQQEVQTAIEELEKDLEETLRRLPRPEREQRDAVRALDRETARFAIAQPIEDCKAHVRRPAEGRAAPRCDPGRHPGERRAVHRPAGAGRRAAPAACGPAACSTATRSTCWSPRRDGEAGAPVIEEVHPTLSNLVGRIEHLAVQGALVTNFRLIKPGSLHRANGGALMIDLRNLLAEPLSWAALKRALLRQEIVIEDAARFMGMTTTVTLEPDPIPLDVKVVLFGDRTLYYMLVAADPDTAQHFKVLADFDDDVDRSPASEMMIARLIGSIAANAGLKPLDRGGVARVIEHAARLADDAGKLTLLVESIHDLVAEASHCAGQSGRERGDARLCRGGDRAAAPPRRARRGARPRDDPARHRADRHDGQQCRTGQRAQRHGARGPRVRPTDPHHRARASRQRPHRRYRARGGTRRAAAFQGRADPERLPRRPLCARRADVAVCQPGVRAVLWRRGRRQRLVRGTCTRCCRRWRRCRCGRTSR